MTSRNSHPPHLSARWLLRICPATLVAGLLLGIFDAPFWFFYVALLVMVPSMFYETWAAEEGGKAEEAQPQSCGTEHLNDAPGRAARPGAR